MRGLPAWLLVPVLVLGALAGCAQGDGGGSTSSPSGSPGPLTASTRTATATRAPASSSPEPASWPRCRNADGFSVAYPPGWVTTAEGGAVPGCAWFGPKPFTVVPNTDERPAPIAVKVERVPFATVSATAAGQLARTSTTVAQRQAVRIEERATGEGLLPAGTPVVRYAVDVAGAVPDGGTLVLDLVGAPGTDLRTLTGVLDRMAASVRLTAR